MRGKPSALGDTKISPNNYHYTRTEKGWELTHRVVMEKHIGRKLAENERVKFIDSSLCRTDPANIIPSNLEISIVKAPTPEKRLQVLESRLEDLLAEIEEVKEEIKVKEAKSLSKR